jgi:hypothetical protein
MSVKKIKPQTTKQFLQKLKKKTIAKKTSGIWMKTDKKFTNINRLTEKTFKRNISLRW